MIRTNNTYKHILDFVEKCATGELELDILRDQLSFEVARRQVCK